MSRFRFLNVGQGLFYSGLIDDSKSIFKSEFRFVFDCGSLSDDHDFYVKNAINHEFCAGENIDIVFVSHLDDDHTNGLDYLNSRTNIKEIVLPYLYNEKTIFLTYLAVLTIKKFSKEEITNYTRKMQLFSKYLFNDKSEKIYFKHVSSADEKFDFFVSTFEKNGWEFYLINRTINKKIIINIKNDIKKLVGSLEVNDLTNFVSKSKGNLESIKNIYKKYVYDLNLSSIVLFHSPVSEGIRHDISMLTGDALFSREMIKECLKYIQGSSIDYFQIPHHGALKNWNSISKIKPFIKKYFVSYGLGNKYGHPSAKLVSELHRRHYFLNSSYQSIYSYFLFNEYKIE